MKIRTLTLGISLSYADFEGEHETLNAIIDQAVGSLHYVEDRLVHAGYEVQTIRISLNNFENWTVRTNILRNVEILDSILSSKSIDFCSIGSSSNEEFIRYIPQLLKVSNKFFASVCISGVSSADGTVIPDINACKLAASIIKEITNDNPKRTFNICVSGNCQPNIPFFPASYHALNMPATLTVGLENADLLFIAFHGVTDHTIAQSNLYETLRQALTPLDELLSEACLAANICFGGIDASICPGLELPVDSVGAGLEQLLTPKRFGDFGTLHVISVVTGALRLLREKGGIHLVGYCGVMLPVAEDEVLAARASLEPGTFTIRDLLAYSSVCGVGIDTVPVSGDASEEELSGLYADLAAMAFRLKKPLSCR